MKLFLKSSLLVGGLLFAALGSNVNATTEKVVGENTQKEDAPTARQCCSRSIAGPGGGVVVITACAGWAFSNDAAAMTRACAKVNAAIGQ